MSRRVYICPVIGDGSDGNSYRPLIADLINGSWSACIHSITEPGHRDRGKPANPWSLVRAQADDWSDAEPARERDRAGREQGGLAGRRDADAG